MLSSRWWAPIVLTAALGSAALALPAPVHAQSVVGRALVDIADVVVRGGVPYYRYGNYGQYDRLSVQHDHHGHPTYYGTAYPADHGGAHFYAAGPHGLNAYNGAGYRNGGHAQQGHQRQVVHHEDAAYYNGGYVQQGHAQQVVGHGIASYYGDGHGQPAARSHGRRNSSQSGHHDDHHDD